MHYNQEADEGQSVKKKKTLSPQCCVRGSDTLPGVFFFLNLCYSMLSVGIALGSSWFLKCMIKLTCKSFLQISTHRYSCF